MKLRITEVCPIHFPEDNQCSAKCLPAREQFVLAAHALESYWNERKRGMRPRAEYQRRLNARWAA